MEDSWELVTVPSEIQRSTVGKQSPSEGSETSLEKNEENSKSKVCEKTRNVGKQFYETSHLFEIYKWTGDG